MQIQIHTATGLTLTQGKGFRFNGSGYGQYWEVIPVTSGRIHGIALGTVDEFSNYDAFLLGSGPCQVQLSENVSAGDLLALSATGFKKKTISDILVGEALLDGTSGNITPAFLYGFDLPFNQASIAQGDLLYCNGTSWIRLPADTSGKLLQTNGAGSNPSWVTAPNNLIQTASAKVTTDQTTTSSTLVDLSGASVTINTQAGSKVMINVSYSMSNASALGSINRVALVIDGVVEPQLSSVFQTPLISNFSQGGSITTLKTGLSAGSHTFKLQWSNTTGTAQCRPLTAAPNTEHASITVMEVKV